MAALIYTAMSAVHNINIRYAHKMFSVQSYCDSTVMLEALSFSELNLIKSWTKAEDGVIMTNRQYLAG